MAAEDTLRNFKGIWLPKEVYLDTRLNWTEKILLVEIDSLDNEQGCFASNAYFAKFMAKDKMYISQCIAHLKELKLVTIKLEHNTARTIRSNIRLLYGEPPVAGEVKKPTKKKEFEPPSLEDVVLYFYEKGYSQEAAKKAYDYYTTADWHDGNSKKIKNWKQKMIGVWFRDENKESRKATLQNGEIKFEGKLTRT